MNRRSRRASLLLLIAVVAAAALVGRGLALTGPLKKLELSTIDTRFDIRGKHAPRADVVIVAVDDRTIAANGLPLNRKLYAAAIDKLVQAGAKTIAVDVQFTEPSPDEEADNKLYDAVANSGGRVVLSTTEVGPGGSTQILGGNDVLKEIHATPAAAVVPRDSDGAIRRLQYRVDGLDSLPVATAKHQLGGRFELPAGTDAPIAFAGPAGTFPVLSLDAVDKGFFDPASVRGKVVVIGATAKKSQDFHRTATDPDMTGPEIQASAIATALDGFPLHHASALADWLLLIVLTAIAPLAAARFGLLIALVADALVTAAFVVGAQIAFSGSVIVDVVAPVGGSILGLVGAAAIAPPARAPWVDRTLDRLTGSGGNQRTRRLRASLLLTAAVALLLLGLGLQAANVLSRLEFSTVDQRFSIRGHKAPPSDIVLVAIDDKTFTLPPKPDWPFSRDDHAKVIRNLAKAGAKVIAYDVQFTENSGDDKADTHLVEAVRDAGPNRVVLATTEVRPDGATEIFGGGDALKESRATPSFSAYPRDSDGSIRRLPYDENGLIGFDLAATELYLGHPVAKPPGESAWINFPGPPGTIHLLSFVDVKNNKFPPAAVRGKIVVVGSTSSVLQDFHATSTTGVNLMAGPEIHAQGIETALQRFPIHTVPGWINVLLVVVVSVAAPLAGLRLGLKGAVSIGAVAVIALLAGAQVVFNADGAIVTVIYALLGGLAGILLTAAIHGLTVAFEREQARDAFARFVPEAVVDQVLRDAEGVRLGGVRREGTVMFSDLRGFTSFSETLEPEQVIESLNMYLTEMSEAILDHGGTLVAYMGDGIMAVFGAPLKQNDHADRALEAARDMLSRMEKFNAYLREKGLNEGGFKMGIGLNSGPVMSGNVGSERRLEYTALGDTTNTAARLEGMTKGTPHQLFVADTTRSMLTRPADDLIKVGEAEVRGRQAKVLLWSLADQPAPPPDPGAPAAEPASQPQA